MRTAKSFLFFSSQEKLMKLKKAVMNGSKTVSEMSLATTSLSNLPFSGHLWHLWSQNYQLHNFYHWCLFIHVKKKKKKSFQRALFFSKNISLLSCSLPHTQRQIWTTWLQSLLRLKWQQQKSQVWGFCVFLFVFSITFLKLHFLIGQLLNIFL